MIYKSQNIVGSLDEESQEGKNIGDHEIESLLEKAEPTIISIPQKTPTPFILAIVGMIASGKSTVMHSLAEHFSLINISTDKIRKMLNNNHYNLRRTTDIAFHLVNKYLENGYGIAIDADAVKKHNREEMKKIAKRFSLPILFIHIKTPENIILKRLDTNNLKRDYRGQEAIDRYFARKPLHEDIDIDFIYTFDGSKDLENQLKEAIEIISHRIEA